MWYIALTGMLFILLVLVILIPLMFCPGLAAIFNVVDSRTVLATLTELLTYISVIVFLYGIYFEIWCCSLRARYICIVVVQHRHSGKIDLQSWQQLRNQFLWAPTVPLQYHLSKFHYLYNYRFCITKSKQNLQAQAARVWTSRNSSTSPNITQPQPLLNQWMLIGMGKVSTSKEALQLQTVFSP